MNEDQYLEMLRLHITVGTTYIELQGLLCLSLSYSISLSDSVWHSVCLSLCLSLCLLVCQSVSQSLSSLYCCLYFQQYMRYGDLSWFLRRHGPDALLHKCLLNTREDSIIK